MFDDPSEGQLDPFLGQSVRQQVASLIEQMMQLRHQGEYERAIGVGTEARELASRYLGEHHLMFAGVLNNLAAVYRAKGNYNAAEPLYHRAVDISRDALGKNDPRFASALNGLTLLYQDIGDYSKAEQLLHESFKIRRDTLGEYHREVAHP